MKIINNRISQIVEGLNVTDGICLSQVDFCKKITINGLFVGDTTIIDINNGGVNNAKFIPSKAIAILDSITGSLATGPSISIGNNSGASNICTSTTFTGFSIVNQIKQFTMPPAPERIDLSANPIVVRVNSPATGAGLTQYSLDILLFGKLV